MLASNYPDVLEWGKYLEQLSSCRPFVAYTWNSGPGHPQPEKRGSQQRSASASQRPGPGQYRTPMNLPLYEPHEMAISVKSHCSVDPVHRIPKESRFSKEGIIKGLVQRSSNPNGPGYYVIPEYKRGGGGYSFPKAIETPDQVRARSVATAVPPPGSYEIRGMFDPSDDEDEPSPVIRQSKPSREKAGKAPPSTPGKGVHAVHAGKQGKKS